MLGAGLEMLLAGAPAACSIEESAVPSNGAACAGAGEASAPSAVTRGAGARPTEEAVPAGGGGGGGRAAARSAAVKRSWERQRWADHIASLANRAVRRGSSCRAEARSRAERDSCASL